MYKAYYIHRSDWSILIYDTDFIEWHFYDEPYEETYNIVLAIINVYEQKKLNVGYNLSIFFANSQKHGQDMSRFTDPSYYPNDRCKQYIQDAKKYLMLV